MNVRNIKEAKDWFEVLQTSGKTQTALMTLQPGQPSGDKPEAHKNSDQVLLVLKGEVCAEVEEGRRTLTEGDIILIPKGTKHRFVNKSKNPVVTFNTYSPPEY